MVHFIVQLQEAVSKSEAYKYAGSIEQLLIKESNGTEHSSSFRQNFYVDPSSISAKPGKISPPRVELGYFTLAALSIFQAFNITVCYQLA